MRGRPTHSESICDLQKFTTEDKVIRNPLECVPMSVCVCVCANIYQNQKREQNRNGRNAKEEAERESQETSRLHFHAEEKHLYTV